MMRSCQSINCEMPGLLRENCTECERGIVRCEACHVYYEKLKVCVKCTGGRGKVGIPREVEGHEDEEWDLDANGALSNAIRWLEEGC